MLIAIRDREPEESVSKIQSDRWTHFSETFQTNFPTIKITTDNEQDALKTYGQRLSHNRLEAFTNAVNRDFTIEYLSLIGLNRDEPSAPPDADIFHTPNQFRVVIDDLTTVDVQQPSVVATGFSTTNLTGAFSVLNQPINPPEDPVSGYATTALTANNDTLDTVLILRFEDFAHIKNLALGTENQTFLVHCRDSVSLFDLPVIDVELQLAGASTLSLALEDIESTAEGFIFKYHWDPTGGNIPVNSGSIGMKITGQTNGTSTVEFMSVAFRTAVVVGGANGVVYDTGFIDLTGSDRVIVLPGVTVPEGEQYRVLIEFSDFSWVSTGIVGSTEVFVYHPLATGLTVGRYAAGEAINVPLLAVGGANLRKSGTNQSALLTSYGGHLRANRVDLTRWEVALAATPQSQTRIFGELDKLFRDIGFTIPTLWIIDAADVVATLWAIVTRWESNDLGALIGEDYPGAGETTEHRYDLRIDIIGARAHSTKIDQ